MKKVLHNIIGVGAILGVTFFAPLVFADVCNTNSGLFTNASSNYLVVTNNLGINGGNVTMGGWFYLNSNPPSHWSMMQTQSGTSHVGFSMRYFNAGGGTHYFVRFLRDFCNVGGTSSFDSASQDWSLHAWHQVYLTYDGTTLKGYIDGSSAGSVATSGNGTTCASGTGIGAIDTGSTGTYTVDATRQWDGLIDDARFYNADIGATTIGTLFSAPTSVAGSETSLVDGWPMNTDLTTDVGSGAHNLTNTNSVTQSATVPFAGTCSVYVRRNGNVVTLYGDW